MSWDWASGGTMLKDGKPDLTNADVKATVEYVKSLWDAERRRPRLVSRMKEQDKVEEFTNGRVGMMIDSLAHINLIRKNNPDLKFSISAIPAKDGYTGKRGIPYASWGIGVSENSKHKAEAFKLVVVPDERDDQLQARRRSRTPSPATRQPCPTSSTNDDAVQGGVRHLQGGLPGQRVHRPAGRRGAHALASTSSSRRRSTVTQSVDEML